MSTTRREEPLDSDLMNRVSELRVAYSNEPLDDAIAGNSPFPLFDKWFGQARKVNEPEPNAMCLSTVNHKNRPSARVVLLKAYDERGFVWYTNYNSSKAKHLSQNPYASLTFFWPTLERSVRIEGIVRKVDAAESEAYFVSRPAESRLGAWSSEQSEELHDREDLETRWENLQSEYLGKHGELLKDIDRPPHWGGYRLVPDMVEFWKGRAARLHDRLVFERPEDELIEGKWTKKRLQP